MDELALARVGAPHGVQGYVKLCPFSGETDHLLGLREVCLKKEGSVLYALINDIKACGGEARVKFSGYDSPETARALTGMELWAPRDKAAPLKQNQYYYADLAGCSLIDAGGATRAVVVSVCEGGGGELLEVKKTDGSKCYVPFRKEFIGTVDIQNKKITLLAPWILDEAD